MKKHIVLLAAAALVVAAVALSLLSVRVCSQTARTHYDRKQFQTLVHKATLSPKYEVRKQEVQILYERYPLYMSSKHEREILAGETNN